MLEKLVDAYTEKVMHELNLPAETVADTSSEAFQRMKKSVSEEVRKEIKEQLEADEIQRAMDRVDCEEKKKREAWKKKNLSEIIIDSIVLAAIVGLIVGQLTNVIFEINAGMGWSAVVSPLIWSILFAVFGVLFGVARFNNLKE